MHYDRVRDALYPNTGDIEDFSYERVRRLLQMLRGESVSTFSGVEGFEVFSDRVEPHAEGLARRMWYGGASLRSAQWAGENAMNFLTSNVTRAEESEDFDQTQLSHINTFRAHHPDGKTVPAFRKAWSSFPPTVPHPNSGRSTWPTRRSEHRVQRHRRARRG